MDKPVVATRLEGVTYECLKRIAQHQDRKIGYLVRKAVEQFVQTADKPQKSKRSPTTD